jgi:hypothetical protein
VYAVILAVDLHDENALPTWRRSAMRPERPMQRRAALGSVGTASFLKTLARAGLPTGGVQLALDQKIRRKDVLILRRGGKSGTRQIS